MRTLASDIEKGDHKAVGPTFASQSRLFYKVHTDRLQEFWRSVRNRHRERPSFTIMQSIKGAVRSSVINVLLLLIPFAWVSHFLAAWGHSVTFALCFLSIIPLERMFDWGGEQMAYYLGEELGDLLIITLNNAVEAALAIILLVHCELRLLQATIVGVIVLHLLLIPGTSFLTGGMQTWQQELTEHTTELNHSLLLLGIMAILLPTAFFAALDRGSSSAGSQQFPTTLVNDNTRGQLLKMSRGLSVLLLIVYICSRIFVHTSDPEGERENSTKRKSNEMQQYSSSPQQLERVSSNVHDDLRYIPAPEDSQSPECEKALDSPTEPDKLQERLKQLKTGPGVCFVLLVITVGVMATTAEFLVESIEFVRIESDIEEEWFGLILLPIVSFAGDGTLAIIRFAISILNHATGKKFKEPRAFAQARAIDLSIQFALFWMPMLVLLGWCMGKPMHLMFDYFELALLLGACFLVNYVTADLKTNWVEGLIMITCYLMIAICSWFYVGQPELAIMLTCPGSIAGALSGGGESSG